MKKCLFLLTLIFGLKAKSQFAFGLISGYSNNHLLTNFSNRINTQNKNGNNYGLGIALNYQLNSKINFQSEINLLHKDFSVVRTRDYEGIYAAYRNIYLQLPIIFQYKLFEKNNWNFYIDGGCSFLFGGLEK